MNNKQSFTVVENKKSRKAKNAPKPTIPTVSAVESVPTEGILFDCAKCTFKSVLPRMPGASAKFRYTCPWSIAHEFKVASYAQAQELLCTTKLHTEVDTKNYRARKACEFLWSFDQSDRPASIAVVNGSYTRGIKEAGDRMLWTTHYQLTPAQLKCLQTAHPGYWFVTGTSHHDHPLAHINTQISSRGLIARIVKNGGKWLDLHGNPSSNARTNVRHPNVQISTMVELCTPKDHIRASTKWGNWKSDPSVFQASMRDISVTPSEDKRTLLGGLSGAMSIHTLYYYERREITSMLSMMRGAPLHAIVHRFPDNQGSLSYGEMKYSRSAGTFGDRITQTNVETGESYEHPDNEWIFSGASSWHDNVNGMGWTTSKAGVDTYLVTFTSVPVSSCRMDPFASNGRAQSHLKDETVSVVLPTDLTPTTFDKVDKVAARAMIAHVSGKARTTAQFKDHLAATKRKMKAGNTLETKSVTQTAVFSFVSEMEAETEVLRVVSDLRAHSRELSQMLGTGTVLDEMSVLSKALTVAATLSGDKKLGSCFRMGAALSRTHGESLE